MLALSFIMFAAPAARAETRTLKLFYIHTKEKAEITFKRNGRYDQDGLKKINRFLRDWRRNEPTKMDPRLLDLVWETYRAAGGRDYIHVVSAYRSPATNSMLRSRSRGVAEKSQHMLGKAMDFYIPGVSLKKLRDTGLKMQTGGVGYYPRSGSPFVHLDVGNVRHWPRMSRKELVAVFPNGKTLHVPSDGKPLPGFQTALASYQSRKKSGTTALALASSGSGSKSGGLLSALFGGGADEEEDGGEIQTAAAKPKATKSKVEAAEAKSSGKIKVVPPELADRVEVAAATDDEEIVAALPTRDVPLPAFAPRPKADVGVTGVPFGTAEALPEDDEAEADLAEGIPLPAWRPDAVDGEADEDEPVLVAMADGPVNAARAITIGEAPLPQPRPGDGEFSVAGLPAGDAALEAEAKENDARLAMLSATDTGKPAVIVREKRDPLAIGIGAKTTKKAARAKAKDTKPDPKPLVIAAQPDAARWALYSGGYVAGVAGPENAAPVAHDLVRTVPSEVYATGFQQGAEVADAGRFSGKAVSFMPVARFETN
jgi:uncharacterized protein YcbK (DUF882 family)